VLPPRGRGQGQPEVHRLAHPAVRGEEPLQTRRARYAPCHRRTPAGGRHEAPPAGGAGLQTRSSA